MPFRGWPLPQAVVRPYAAINSLNQVCKQIAAASKLDVYLSFFFSLRLSVSAMAPFMMITTL
jgi:hypothetical protein